MEHSTALRWSWTNVLTKKRMDALLSAFASLDDAMDALSEDLLRSLGCREETIINVLERLESFDEHAYQKELDTRELTMIAIDDDVYPTQLKTIDDPPIFLYYKGSLEITKQPCIAAIGTRTMSAYGDRVTEAFVPPLVRAGMVTVSGLAYGIDAAVAKETLLAGGNTIAVLGHGLGMISPKAHRMLADDIVTHGGLLLSEFPLDVRPDKYTFPARNRIIAGLSLGALILEATEDSGSLITADLALDYNRDVFAVPGNVFDPNYAGCHALIRKGSAQLVTTPEDVLTTLGIAASRDDHTKTIDVTLGSEEEKALFNVLTTMPKSIDEIAVHATLDAASIGATLTMLEMRGIAKNIGDGKWVRA